MVRDVTPKDLDEAFPPHTILEKWHKGEDAEWPPFDDLFGLEDEEMEDMEEIEEEEQNLTSALPALRFKVGQKVQCRIGPDPVNGWASGKIIQLWYQENGWPADSWAPYKVELDSGRRIFAPGDIDDIIRAILN